MDVASDAVGDSSGLLSTRQRPLQEGPPRREPSIEDDADLEGVCGLGDSSAVAVKAPLETGKELQSFSAKAWMNHNGVGDAPLDEIAAPTPSVRSRPDDVPGRSGRTCCRGRRGARRDVGRSIFNQ